MQALADKISAFFPDLREPALLATMEQYVTVREVSAGTTIIDIGSEIRFMPLVTKGAIKVLREDEKGDELFLYFLYPGQSCAMTMHCCTTNARSQVRAIAEEETEILVVPVERVDPWLKEFAAWRNFVLLMYSDRFTELLNTIDSIVFQQLDARLLQYLHERAAINDTKVIHISHQQIADDLHSSREVISRLLKQIERQKKILLGRNKIELV